MIGFPLALRKICKNPRKPASRWGVMALSLTLQMLRYFFSLRLLIGSQDRSSYVHLSPLLIHYKRLLTEANSTRACQYNGDMSKPDQLPSITSTPGMVPEYPANVLSPESVTGLIKSKL